MSYDTLGDFLTVLLDAGDLLRIDAVVDPALEAAAISEHLGELSGVPAPALWFSGLRNSAWPLITNLLGHPRRIGRAWSILEEGSVLDELQAAIGRLWTDREDFQRESERFAGRLIRQAGCQQVIKLGKDVNLWELPALRSWPEEPAPAMHGVQVIFPSFQQAPGELFPSSLQLIDRQRLLPYWTAGHPALAIVEDYRRQQRQLPIALAFGGDPRLNLCGDLADWLNRPLSLSEVGLLRKRSLNVVKCRSHDLQVPADAELIIEGFVDAESAWESLRSLSLSSGHYSAETNVPVVQVTAITHRANPICVTTIAGSSAKEEHWRRAATDRMMMPTLQRLHPQIRDVARPIWGDGRVATVRVEKNGPFAAHAACHALWSCPGLRYTKWMIVVEGDVDLHDEAAVWSKVAQNVDPSRDLMSLAGAAHPDDHAAGLRGKSGRVAIDATRKRADENYPRVWPPQMRIPDEVRTRVQSRWQELGLTDRKGTGN